MAEQDPTQKYLRLEPHRIAALVIGRREVNGDESRAAMRPRQRASLVEALNDGDQVGLRLRADAVKAYSAARDASLVDGKLPDSFRAPAALEPVTHLLERIAVEKKVTLTIDRKVVRQGADGRTSRMSVNAVELAPGDVAVVGLKTGIKMLTRYPMLLEPCATPRAKVHRADEIESDDGDQVDDIEPVTDDGPKTGPKQRKRAG